MRRVLVVLALVVAVLVDGFFALVNFYPVAPPRERGPRRYVVAEMDEGQAEWFQANVLDEYNDAHYSNLVLRATLEEEISEAMRASDVVAAVLPATRAADVAEHGGARPFDEAVRRERIARDFADVRGAVMRGARWHDRQFFLPRAIALDVGVYRISRVRDAMLHWQLVRPQIEAALRAVNGRGLPAGYALEEQPSEWDSYDQFVLGFYWAHRAYDGKPARARIEHRSGAGIDAQLDVAAAIYRAGADDATIGTRDATPSVDWFQWEALYRLQGLYPPEMFEPGGVDDEGTIAALQRGDVYLTSLDQLEAFTVHGGAHRGAQAKVPDEDDLGFVALPRFASLELDAHGLPTRTADVFSFREESVWVLPVHGADAQLAYRLAAWVLDRETHVRECEALGTLPARNDVVRERATLFRAPWMQDVFAAGLAQWRRAQVSPPGLEDELGVDYAVAWDRIVAHRRASPADRAAIAASLREPVDRAAALRTVPPDAAQPEVTRRRRRAAFVVPPLREQVVIEGLEQDAGTEGAR